MVVKKITIYYFHLLKIVELNCKYFMQKHIFINFNTMKSSRIVILVLLCVSAFTWTNSCPGFNAGDLLQSGKNSFIKSGSRTQYTFDSPISYPIPSRGLELAVTAATIGDYDPSQGGFSFNVNGRRRGNTGFVEFTVIVNSQNSWSSIQVSWFASSRDDFAVANIQYPVNTWVRGSSADSYELIQAIPKTLPEGKYQVAAFISGFSTSDNQFKISIDRRSYDSWSRKLTISFFCGANPQPNTITVSYIIYPENHAIFEISYEVSPKGESGAYQISGPVNFGTNNIIEYNQFRIANRFMACTGNQCPNTCILREECFELNGTAYEGQCVFCPIGIVVQFGRCTRRCGPNQVYSNRVCICEAGFVRRGNACVQDGGNRCNKDQIQWGNGCRRCPADASANPGQNTCNCRGGYTYDANSNTCIQNQPTCQFGQVYNRNRCVCAQNWGRYNGQCRQCPSGSSSSNNEECVCASGYTYDPQSNSCVFNVPNCGSNKRWDGVKCVCNPGLIEWNGQCRPCPNGAQPNYQANTCSCANNFRYDAQSNACLPVNNCPDTYQWDGSRCRCPNNFISWANRCRACPNNSKASKDQTTCVCDSNWQFDGANNRCVNPCQQNEYPSGNNCLCVAGFYRYNNGACKACPSNSRPNPAQTTCTCNRGDQTFDIINNKCVVKNNCGTNQVVGNNGQCVCVAGAVRYNNQCRQCPTNSKANQNTNTCVCQDGFTFDAQNNNCVSRCGLSQVWKNGKCECISGYSWFGNGCRQCPQSARPTADQRACVCSSATAIYISNSNICLECGANSQPNAQKTACLCLPGFTLNNNVCESQVQCEFNQDLVNGNCQCKFGWVQLGPQCVERCGINQYWDGKACPCKEGHAKSGGVCRPCPSGTVTNGDKTACLCNDPRSVYVPARNTCELCPAFSAPNADDTDCICFAGYRKQGSACVSNCPADATPDATGACVCSGGKFWANNQCNQPSVCPDRSTFNQQTSSCVCNDRKENIIEGVCKPCGQNSVWNNGKCVCSTGFFSIGGVCRTCDPRTKYDGTDCVCQLGYFGNRDLCTPCHKSCSKCTGPQANQCQSCSDVSLVLKDGYCARNSPCNYGFYLEGNQCSKCIDNCIDCDNTFECRTCAIGYIEKPLTVSGQNVVTCEQICGDGIKYEQRCDDGNTKSGDGCSATCEEEPGWFCSGGSSNKPSVCRKFIPDRVQLSSKGAVNLGGKVILSIRASYLPECLTKNECVECFKVIKANVVNVNVPVLLTVSHVPFSQWQFYLTIDFQGLYVSSIFKVVIKLNEDFKGCIAAEDYDEQLELTVDPAFLALIDETPTLSLDLSGQPVVVVPEAALSYLGS